MYDQQRYHTVVVSISCLLSSLYTLSGFCLRTMIEYVTDAAVPDRSGADDVNSIRPVLPEGKHRLA